MGDLLRCVAAVLAAGCSVAALSAQAAGTRQPSPQVETPAEATTPTYVDLPLKKLKSLVPALDGLKPDDRQQGLGPLLQQIAGTIAHTLPKLPDVISQEDVYRAQGETGLWAPMIVPGRGLASDGYQYLILSHRSADGTVRIEESRTDALDKPEGAARHGALPPATGFANQWLLFSKANQSEFRFRYLGEQSLGRIKTFAVAFAQVPGKVRVPALFQRGGRKFPFYCQGVLWVDQQSFDVVRLRSDLLEPVREATLDKMTSDIRFNLVRIRGYSEAFWLPVELRISSEQGRLDTEELHLYSKFHLYRTSARVVPAP